MEELKSVFRKVFLKNYANFNGRASRKEFWLFYFMQYLYMTLGIIFFYILFFLVFFVALMKNSTGSSPSLFPVIMMIVVYGAIFLLFLPILLPSLAVTARRLHDTGRSGWWMLLGLVPLGGFVVLFFLIQAGDKYPNEYGDDPLEQEYREYFGKIYPHLHQSHEGTNNNQEI